MVVAVRHGDEPCAETGNMVVEGRVGAERGHHCRAGRGEQAHDQAEQPVNAFADRDRVGRHAESCRERLFEVEIFRVAVAPGQTGRPRHRINHGRGRAETAFIGAEPGTERRAARAFLRFGPDEGHGGG